MANTVDQLSSPGFNLFSSDFWFFSSSWPAFALAVLYQHRSDRLLFRNVLQLPCVLALGPMFFAGVIFAQSFRDEVISIKPSDRISPDRWSAV
jgi:hypothetical protein